MSDIEMNVGVQPLDAIMTEKEIKNTDLVKAAPRASSRISRSKKDAKAAASRCTCRIRCSIP